MSTEVQNTTSSQHDAKLPVSGSASNVWIVKRYIIEEFEVTASTKEEVKNIAQDPCRITVTRETIKRKHYR